MGLCREAKNNRVFEEDVPVAALSRESVEECPAVVQLKRLLTCGGAKTSGTKSALVNR